MNQKNLEIKYNINVNLVIFIEETMKMYKQLDLIQKDTYYVVPEGRLKLREEAGLGSYFIRYFRPDLESQKISLYHKYPVDNIRNFMIVFGDLLKEEVVVKKSRQVFLYKNARIHLDYLPSLEHSRYVEIEVMINNDEEEKNSNLLMNELIVMMKLEKSTIIKNSYREMLMNQ